MPNSVLEILLALSTALALSNAFPIHFVIDPSLVEKSKITWEVLKFIATNYLAHAFTVSIAPGYGWLYSLLFSLGSLTFPYIGLVAACRSLEQMAILERDPLQRAAKAGALCMVTRTKYWKGRNGDPKVWCWQTDGDPTPPPAAKPKRLHYQGLELEPISQRHVGIHGICSLPRYPDKTDPGAAGQPTPGAANKPTLEATGKPTPEATEKPTSEATDKPTPEATDRREYIMVRVPGDFKVPWRTARTPIPDRYIFSSYKEWEVRAKKETAERHEGHCQENCTPREENPNRGTGVGEIGEPEKWMKESSCGISNTYSIPKTAVALVQLFSAVPLIWNAKKSDYGYAAYQLTLIPYALMSMLNIVNTFFTPNYPMLYMIESETMDEARLRGGRFEGTIGKLCELSIDESKNTPYKSDEIDGIIKGYCNDSKGIRFERNDMDPNVKYDKGQEAPTTIWEALNNFTHLISEHVKREVYFARELWRDPGAMLMLNIRRIFNKAEGKSSIMVSPFGCPILRDRGKRDIFMSVIADILLTISLSVPYITTYCLTRYKTGKSTVFQRALFMVWLVLGQVSHFYQRMFWGYLQSRVAPLGTQWLWSFLAVGAFIYSVYALPAAFGILMVAKMYSDDLHENFRASNSTAAISATSSIGATAPTSTAGFLAQ